MKRIKRLIGICAIAVLGTALSGCVVIPFGHGHYRDHYRDHDGYDRR